jgi:SAM-dependent methyltransferase
VAATASVDPARGAPTTRKQLGAWATPHDLVELVVDRTVTPALVERCGARPLRVLDPACGDGRFLAAAAERIAVLGGASVVTGIDIDARALDEARTRLGDGAELVHGDALRRELDLTSDGRRFDVVVGNPPFLSQLDRMTTRGGASRFGGGAYADAAAEFLAVCIAVAEPDGGRVGMVLPQSVLASRDAGPVRDAVDAVATRCWSWWSPRPQFDADVLVCALGFERGARDAGDPTGTWTSVVLDALGVPELPPVRAAGTVGDRCAGNVNFRDEYYGLVPAVGDDADGPPLVTSGLIDPARCHWGDRPVRFARRTFAAPRVDLTRLDPRMQAWAARKLVPKVLVANQTRVIEAVADTEGAWLPGVPVTTLTPTGDASTLEIAAVLTSPVATAVAWHQAAGTGLSARAVRVGPALLRSLPWPAGRLDDAVDAVRRGDVQACGAAVDAAFGVPADDHLLAWWTAALGGFAPL